MFCKKRAEQIIFRTIPYFPGHKNHSGDVLDDPEEDALEHVREGAELPVLLRADSSEDRVLFSPALQAEVDDPRGHSVRFPKKTLTNI